MLQASQLYVFGRRASEPPPPPLAPTLPLGFHEPAADLAMGGGGGCCCAVGGCCCCCGAIGGAESS